MSKQAEMRDSVKIDLDLVERNLRNGNYLLHQVPPYALAFIARIRELEVALERYGDDEQHGELIRRIVEKGAVVRDQG
jgi:hypothetical protein